nr:disintegrin and metalloproteinase domain-containing protein 2-like isoform X4 [Anser cygnoides]
MTTDVFKVYTHPCHLIRSEGAGNVVHVPFSFKTLHWEQRRLFLCASGTAPRASFVVFGCNERAFTEPLCKKRAIKMPVLYKSALVCSCFPGTGTVPNGRSVGQLLVGPLPARLQHGAVPAAAGGAAGRAAFTSTVTNHSPTATAPKHNRRVGHAVLRPRDRGEAVHHSPPAAVSALVLPRLSTAGLCGPTGGPSGTGRYRSPAEDARLCATHPGAARGWSRAGGMLVPVTAGGSGFWICKKPQHRRCAVPAAGPSASLRSSRIYTYNEKGSLYYDSPQIKGDCYYRGYIEGVPGSAVTLSTCSGLRGLLQFENASYGIEPLVNSPAFEHFIYQMSNESMADFLLAKSRAESGARPAVQEVSYKAHTALELLSKHHRELALHLILERNLYNYLGADKYVVTQKIVQIISSLSSMFSSLNMTITLSSMEVWMDKNKFQTGLNGEEVLMQLLKWKTTSAALRPYEVPYLLLYRDRASYAGATIPGKACQRDAAGAVAVYQRSVTLESFSVLLAQVLARSLGMSYDNNRGCRCPGHVCVMGSEALRVSGAKSFSSCNAEDFENFLKQNPECPFIRVVQRGPLSRAAVCGNGVMEHGEQCDCGSVAACAVDKCCTSQCKLKPGVKCSSGRCCENCQFKAKNSLCRPPADVQCDLAEYCNGSSASCPPDFYVQDGHDCEHGTGYCYKGRCQSADLQCRRLYGTGIWDVES